jgi:hypothetical protein
VKKGHPNFYVILAEAIHEGLSSIGPLVPSVVFFYLKKNGSIRSDQCIDDPKAFEEGLKKIFGFGAKVIERKILEVLYAKLHFPLKIEDDFKFLEEVKKAQKLFDSVDLVVEEA